MSVKDPKFRTGLKMVILLMFGMVIYNSINDIRVYQGNQRRISALNEISTLKPIAPERLEVVRR